MASRPPGRRDPGRGEGGPPGLQPRQQPRDGLVRQPQPIPVPQAGLQILKLLRNSFSRLKSRQTAGSCARPPAKSRSVDILKRGGGYAEAKTEAEDCEEDVITPIDEEMVAASRRQELPIISFPCPNFVILDKNLEETKVLVRENPVKDLFVNTD